MQGRREKQEDRHVIIRDLHKVAALMKLPGGLEKVPKPALMMSVSAPPRQAPFNDALHSMVRYM